MSGLTFVTQMLQLIFFIILLFCLKLDKQLSQTFNLTPHATYIIQKYFLQKRIDASCSIRSASKRIQINAY